MENYAENERGKTEMSTHDEVAAEAVALAVMQTQVGDLPAALDSIEAETLKDGVSCNKEGGYGDE